MIKTYIGKGLTSLAEKLQELWSFKNAETDGNGMVTLWISDEICISLTESLCTVKTTAHATTVNPMSGASNTYHWKIVRTKCGIAFGPEAMAYVFVGRTVRCDGVESVGCIARPYGSASYNVFTDTQAAAVPINANGRFIKSDHYTQLYPATCPSANAYFPDIYFIAQSPQTTNRVTQIGTDLYFCNEFIALRDTPAQTSSGGEPVDLSAYYTGAQVEMKIRGVEQVIAEVENSLSAEIKSLEQSVEALDNDLHEELESVTADIFTMKKDSQSMSRTVTASTEQEVREALQFAAAHPGCYLNLTLAAGLNAVVPTLYIRNAIITINGTEVNGAISNTLTFEQTGTTSNLHVQYTSLTLTSIAVEGNHNHSTAGYGVVRLEYGSTLYCNKVVFGQAQGSLNFGNNIEARDCSTAFVANSSFCILSTASNAAGIYVTSAGDATAKNCTFIEESLVTRIARLENGAKFNQIGTEYGVYMADGHASICRLDGKEQEV